VGEKFWGTAHGDMAFAAMSLVAILEDDAGLAATWWGWMEEMLDELWDGSASGHSYWAIFKHFGADGGTHKGAGPSSYFTQNERFYARLLPILDSGLGVDNAAYDYWYWYLDSVLWLLWHWRGDRGFHRENEGYHYSKYDIFTQVHCLQYMQVNGDTALCRAVAWLESEIRAVANYAIWGPFNIHNVVFRETRTVQRPTLQSINSSGAMRVFRNSRKIIFRTNWETGGISMTLCAARFVGGHSKPGEHAGHVELASQGDPVFISAGGYDPAQTTTYRVPGSASLTGHRWTYAKGLAHSICSIYDSNEPAENKEESFQSQFSLNSFFGTRNGSDVIANNGGVLWPKDLVGVKYQPDDLTAFLAESKWNYETFAIEPRETPQFCYAVLNLLPMFYGSKCSRYRRHVVWIKPGAAVPTWQYPIIVVWDDIISHAGDPVAERTNILAWMSKYLPVVESAQQARMFWSGPQSKTWLRLISPATSNVAIQSGYTDRNGISYPATKQGAYDDSAGGCHRMDLWPTGPTTTPTFISVIFTGPLSLTAQDLPQIQSLSLTGYVGVVFSDYDLRLKIATGDTHSAVLEAISANPPATNDARRSLAALCMGLGLGVSCGPFPNSISGVDRQHVADIYRGIPAQDWTPPPPPEPPSPPSAPTGLVATAGDASVALDWTDNPELDLTGYNVYRQQVDQFGWWASWVRIAVNPTSDWTDTTVSNGTTYRYRVTALDDDSEESAPSAESASVTPSPAPPAPPPDAPTGQSISVADTTPDPVGGTSIVSEVAKDGQSISAADTTPAPVTGGTIPS
jgi:hypothetical protein